MPVVYPDPRITDKNEVVKWVELYLTEEDNNVADLSSLISHICPFTHDNSSFVRDIAHKMKRTGRYEIFTENIGSDKQYFAVPIPPKSFNEKHPIWFAIIMAFIGAVFALGVKMLSEIPAKQDQHQLDQRQDSTIKAQTDSITSIQNRLSTFRLKSDTGK